MLADFLFTADTYALTLGVQVLDPQHIIVVDPAEILAELRLKQTLLVSESDTYCQAPLATEAMQWDAVAVVLPVLAARYPEWFRLQRNGDAWRWHNGILHTETAFQFGDTASLPQSPLEWLGSQVQEDLLLLANDPARGFPLVAGVLCFPNGWSLAEKMELPLAQIHEPVPGFEEQLGAQTLLLLEGLEAGHPIWRLNWAIQPGTRLNLLPRFADEVAQAIASLAPNVVGDRCVLRVERQTLTRLPTTGAILFTIHTFQTPLARIAANPDHWQRLRGVLHSVPADMLAYKGIDRFQAPLFAYLDDEKYHSPYTNFLHLPDAMPYTHVTLYVFLPEVHAPDHAPEAEPKEPTSVEADAQS
jgi:hypothetical protein